MSSAVAASASLAKPGGRDLLVGELVEDVDGPVWRIGDSHEDRPVLLKQGVGRVRVRQLRGVEAVVREHSFVTDASLEPL
jgi:hypothetical protein